MTIKNTHEKRQTNWTWKYHTLCTGALSVPVHLSLSQEINIERLLTKLYERGDRQSVVMERLR